MSVSNIEWQLLLNLQQRFELAHVLVAQVKCFEARDGRLTEVVVVELAHRQSDVALRETKLDPSSLEGFRKILQFFQIVYLVRLQ